MFEQKQGLGNPKMNRRLRIIVREDLPSQIDSHKVGECFVVLQRTLRLRSNNCTSAESDRRQQK